MRAAAAVKKLGTSRDLRARGVRISSLLPHLGLEFSKSEYEEIAEVVNQVAPNLNGYLQTHYPDQHGPEETIEGNTPLTVEENTPLQPPNPRETTQPKEPVILPDSLLEPDLPQNTSPHQEYTGSRTF